MTTWAIHHPLLNLSVLGRYYTIHSLCSRRPYYHLCFLGSLKVKTTNELSWLAPSDFVIYSAFNFLSFVLPSQYKCFITNTAVIIGAFKLASWWHHMAMSCSIRGKRDLKGIYFFFLFKSRFWILSTFFSTGD